MLPILYAEELVKELHSYYVHIGPKKIFRMMREHFWSRNMRKNISNWLRACDLCQKTKHNNSNSFPPFEKIKIDAPNAVLSIDFIGPLAKAKYGYK